MRQTSADDSFARLLGYLKQAVGEPQSLHPRDVGMIRLILARHIAKHGGPDAEQFVQMRARQRHQVAGPDFHEIAQVVGQRLAPYPPDDGLDAPDVVTRPITEEEARGGTIPPGTELPPSLCRKITRCLSESAEVLVKRGLITSGETLARVIPQFTSGLRAAAFDDEVLRRLYAAIYRAFRRRRSLLLLNLESQVRMEELPWIAAIEPFRRKDPSTRELSHQTLKEVATLTLRAFPHVILPNKLLQELRALAQGAELSLPLVEELAADIFMDDFSPKFTAAAKQAATLLDGSLYVRYYAIDCAAINRLPDTNPKTAPRVSWFGRGDSTGKNPFATLCVARARIDGHTGHSVARNGMVIEQAQILTTQNLSVLFAAFDLTHELRDDLRDMAERCFHWICRRQQTETDNFHATLIMLKNTAYAWRQMIFYLSLLPDKQVREFLTSAETHLNEQSESFRIRFAPALRGLVAVHEGAMLDDDEATDSIGKPRRFLGWATARHWLLDPKPAGKKGG